MEDKMGLLGWFLKAENKEEDEFHLALTEYEKARTNKNAITKRSKQESNELLDTVNGALDILSRIEAQRKK